MKIFGLDLGSGDHKLKITEDDRNWTIENFQWLRDVWGYPKRSSQHFLFTPDFFPATYSKRTIEIEDLISDLCNLFTIPRDIIKIELITDIRDTVGVPYQMGDNPFDTDVRLRKGDHTIYVANSHLKHPRWLLHRLICEFSKIRLVETSVQFESSDDDVFVYLVATYLGFGILLADTMRDVGVSNDGRWETKWNYVGKMPAPVMAFALAVYASLCNDHDPSWKDLFKGDFKKMLIASLAYVKENVSLYDERQAQAEEFFDQSEVLFKNGDVDSALSALQKVLFLSTSTHLKSYAYNNIGYYYAINGDHHRAIQNFQNAIQSDPDFAYPYDNLGYSLILTGDLETGFSYLQKALKTDGNDYAYSWRNFALYYQLKKDRAQAEEFYKKSFGVGTPVDLLEYHYAAFLLEGGDIEKAKEFLLRSVSKNEAPGINKAKELGWY